MMKPPFIFGLRTVLHIYRSGFTKWGGLPLRGASLIENRLEAILVSKYFHEAVGKQKFYVNETLFGQL